MNTEYPLWLIERIEEIEGYIGILQALKSKAFSLSISPVGILTEGIVDLLMQLRKSYQDEAPYTGSLNPEIIFDDDGPRDDLGNIPQRERKFYVKRAVVPEMPQFLWAFAVFFSRSLKKDFNFQKDFHGLLKDLNQILPPGFTSQKSNNAEKTSKKTKQLDANKIARSAYYRRRRQRK
jgi:hypothetical protein